MAPAFYATPRLLRQKRAREWWTLLHPPYTAMHLSFVVIGGCLVGPVSATRLAASLGAFFLAVGVGAHALDELHGRPLATKLATWQLTAAAVAGLGGAVALGVVGATVVGAHLLIFVGAGVTLALGYNLELFGGRLHRDLIFALSWGAFPVLTAYFAQHSRLSLTSALAALFAAFASLTQRRLSSPARELRRRTRTLDGVRTLSDGTEMAITRASVLEPLERALRSLCWMSVALACTFLLLRFHP